MKILFVSAETAPYSLVGGLSQVTYFLAKALIKFGHDVRIFTPLYGCNSLPADATRQALQAGNPSIPSNSSPKFIFFENKFYFGSRQKIYGYHDDFARFAAFSRGCLDWLLRLTINDLPDVIHCHDWHTGMLIHWLKNDPRYSALKHIPVLYTVHNFSYQGNGALTLGLLSADLINTVSPTYAREIKTVKKLTGILNGLDTEEFNPATDKNIEFNYSASVIASPAAGRGNLFEIRFKNKICLQKLFSLPPNSPNSQISPILLAFSGRLVPQKGIDLMLETIPRVLKKHPFVQLIVLGDGENKYKQEFRHLKTKFPKQIGLYLKSNFSHPRQIFAGADIMLIPSKFEPCGIIALESLRYGCIPLVHHVGGLKDVITPDNGFIFTTHTARAFSAAIGSAIEKYQDETLWNKLIKNCLAGDFSWDNSALEYEKLYEKLL